MTEHRRTTPSQPSRIAPRYSVERRLRATWAELLGHRDFGVHDRFFDVDGDSIQAVQLMGRIRLEFGFTLELDDVFRAPTIAGLALLLRGDAGAGGNCLVALKPQGSKPPLFCLHPVGGSVARYFSLASALGSDQPVYALQSRGLSDAARAQDHIGDMAETYLAEILDVSATGPCQLLGYSMGGLLAHEIAVRMRARGLPPATVIMIDTLAEPVQNGGAESALQVLVQLVMKLELDLTGMEGLPLRAALAELHRVGVAQGVLSPDFPADWLERVYHTIAGNQRALVGYSPSDYDGPAILLHGGDDQDCDHGWSSYASDLRTFHLGLGHFVLMEEKGTRRIAAVLAEQHILG